ncbi:MAG TPA: MATE family efflux transporter [Pseudomonadales bacterium]|nr:MATE family efflux transporter [Pseudomonadales bacterium]
MFAEWKILIRLGLPILVAQLAQMANGVIDTIMAGHYGARDLAAVAIGNSFWMPVFLFFLGALGALQPTISGHRGARDMARIIPVTWQGLYIAAVFCVLMVAALSHVQTILVWMHLDADTAQITQRYLAAFAWGVPAMLLLVTLRGLTDGMGHTRIVMLFSLLGTLINLPLNYIFIYGKLGMPEMGGAGCGVATAMANTAAAIALVFYLHFHHDYREHLIWQGRVRPHFNTIKNLLRLGLPIGCTMFFEVSMFTVIALFLAPLGPVVVAGHQIVLNAVSLMFMVPLSLGMALSLRVSFLIGARDMERAHWLARSALLLALCIAMFYVPLLLLGKAGIAALYTDDKTVQDIAQKLLLLAAIFQVADVLQVTAISALRGYRDTRVPMLIILLSFWGVGMPLGYTLTFTDWITAPMGAAGFWIGLIGGIATACVLLVTRLLTFRSANFE